jgi:hypothetical protein
MSIIGELVRIKTLTARTAKQQKILKSRINKIIDASEAVSLIVTVKVPVKRKKSKARKRKRTR